MEGEIVEHHVAADLLAGLHEHVDVAHLLDAGFLGDLEADAPWRAPCES